MGRELRTLVIEMVMSTDMSCHFQQIKTMKNALSQTDKSELKTQPFRNLHTASINLTKNIDPAISDVRFNFFKSIF